MDHDDGSGDDVEAVPVMVEEASASSFSVPSSGLLRRLGFLLPDRVFDPTLCMISDPIPQGEK